MIFEQKRGTIVIPTDDTVVVGTATEVIDGYLGYLVTSVPALEGTGTATILGTESLGGSIYASTAKDESTIGMIPPVGTPTIFSGTLWLTATANGTQSAARNVVYNLYYQTKHG